LLVGELTANPVTRGRSSIKALSLISFFVAALAGLSIAASGCGSSDRAPASREHRPNRPVPGAGAARGPNAQARGDDDKDDSHGSYDNDDNDVRRYGRPAAVMTRGTIVMLIQRYYAAAAGGDGPAACSMLFAGLAMSVPQDYGRPPGPPALRGRTCAVVMAKVFEQMHEQLVRERPALDVRSVRVAGSRALALLRFGAAGEERVVSLRREGSAWKMNGLLDVGLA
jgi:hypothetical protein